MSGRGKQTIKPGHRHSYRCGGSISGWQNLPPGAKRRELLLRHIAQAGLRDELGLLIYPLAVNCEGGIGRDDRDLRRLVKDGMVKIIRDPVQIRSVAGCRSYTGWPAYPVRRCVAVLAVADQQLNSASQSRGRP